MADVFEIQLKGVDELVRRYAQAPQIIRTNMVRSITRITLFGEAESKRIVPKDTRHLMRSITAKTTPIGGGVQGVWGTSVPYGKYVETGTRPHFVPAKYIGDWARRHGIKTSGGLRVSGRAQPFMKPAFEAAKPLARAEFQVMLNRIVRELRGS